MCPASQIRRIGVMTSGGDCPGLNAVIRAVTKTAIFQHSIEVFGIEDGFQGLVENRVRPLLTKDVSGILTRGGTILGSNNRANPARYFLGNDSAGNPRFENRVDTCLQTVQTHRLDALIVIGGDGTMSAVAPLVQAGLNVIGVPKTIDNDMVGTEITFGFLTAVATATDALDRLHSTADSHHRVVVCELMGRNAGWIALTSGVASGSDVILIPEISFDIDLVCELVRSRMDRGPGFAVVAVAEGASPRGGAKMISRVDPRSADPVRLGGIGQWVCEEVEKRTGVESRASVLGHVQRGGQPTAPDRILATHFGHHAIATLMSGARGRMVVRNGNVFGDIDILETAGKQRLIGIDNPLIAAARAIGTSFGDGLPYSSPAAKPSVVF